MSNKPANQLNAEPVKNLEITAPINYDGSKSREEHYNYTVNPMFTAFTKVFEQCWLEDGASYELKITLIKK